MKYLRLAAGFLVVAIGAAWTLACLMCCAIGPFVLVACLVRGCL